MKRSIVRVAAATVAFACLHSALASLPAKRAARARLGERRFRAMYRPFFIGQSVVTFAALVWYLARQPDRVLYRLRGPAAVAAVAGQGAALAYGVWATRRVGFAHITGGRSLMAHLHDEPRVPHPQEAQGPPLSGTGSMDARGPFALSRHPLNLAPVPFFWLSPVMTVNLTTFSAVAMVYFLLGSMHEEHRLLAAYGDAYRAYQRSGVPFYVPRLA